MAEALDSIPDELGGTWRTSPSWSRTASGMAGLLGLYEGVPLTERGEVWHRIAHAARPDHDLPPADLRRCRTEEDVVDQVRVTVIHEVAHHFGIGDARLEELGWA